MELWHNEWNKNLSSVRESKYILKGTTCREHTKISKQSSGSCSTSRSQQTTDKDSRLLIRTADTDVVILAVSVMQTFGAQIELWIGFGTGKNFRYLAAHLIAKAFRPKKALALPLFHALTGCDTASSCVGHGTKSAWSIWNTLPQLTDALLKLSCSPSDAPVEIMLLTERFVILLYDRISTCTNINKAQEGIFTM